MLKQDINQNSRPSSIRLSQRNLYNTGGSARGSQINFTKTGERFDDTRNSIISLKKAINSKSSLQKAQAIYGGGSRSSFKLKSASASSRASSVKSFPTSEKYEDDQQQILPQEQADYQDEKQEEIFYDEEYAAEPAKELLPEELQAE